VLTICFRHIIFINLYIVYKINEANRIEKTLNKSDQEAKYEDSQDSQTDSSEQEVKCEDSQDSQTDSSEQEVKVWLS
jgi:amino acid permease